MTRTETYLAIIVKSSLNILNTSQQLKTLSILHRDVNKFVQPDALQLGEIAVLIDSGHVRPEIAEVFPLHEADKAHRSSETGHTRGKIVLAVIGG